MRNRRVVAIILSVMLMLINPIRVFAVSSGDTLPSGVEKENIGSEIEAYVAEHDDTTAGMAVSVFDRSAVIYRNYFGCSDIANGVAVDKDTVFEWGSATKLLVWVSVMQLWEQGKLDLEADVQGYLPEGFLKNLTHDEPVTMLNLMNHNAGFEESFIGMSTTQEAYIQSLEDYLASIQPQQIFAPGTVTAYSNWGVTLAGYIVERISGMPFYEYVHKNIFAPLGMEHSALNADLTDNPWVKQQRQKLECYTTDAELIPDCMSYIIMYPAGMCTSTLEDFEAFGRAMLDRESELFNDPLTYDFFMKPSAYYGDTDISLIHHGLWKIPIYSASVIGHGGNTNGCSSYLLLDLKNGIGMTVMTNQSGEHNYNYEMPELLFGKYEGEALDFSGYVVDARTIFRGPLKLQQLLRTAHITPENLDGGICVLSECNGIKKITGPYGDNLLTTLPELIVKYLPLMFWVLGLAFCLLNLIVRGICWIVRKILHKTAKKHTDKWTIAACVLQLLPLIPVVPTVASLFGVVMWPRWCYEIVFSTFLIWFVVFAGVALHGILQMVKNRNPGAYRIAVVLTLMISCVNILYWELGAFWLL